MSYRWSPLTDADTAEWATLTAVVAAHDGTEEIYTAEDLAEELAFPGVERELDTVAVRCADTGTLVATGQVFFRDELVDSCGAANTSVVIHPDHRGRGIGTEMTTRLERRAAAIGAVRHRGTATVIRADTGVHLTAARALLTELGYTEARFFHDMVHDFAGLAGRESEVREGLDLRPYDPSTDADAVHDAHTDAFASHWRSAPWSDDEWRSRVLESRAFRPGLSFVRPGTTAPVEGYVISFEYVPAELYIALLGVRPQGRGRGTGSALLRLALRAGLAAGCVNAHLDVDSDNGTGAGRLYEAAGFRVVRSSVAALKTLTPPAST